MNFSGKEHSMKKPFRILLILVTAVSENETEDKEKLRLEAAGDCQKTF